MDWERLPQQSAPYVPRVEHALDTQNFERFDEEAGPPGGSGGKRWARADPNFIGYTYKNWDAVGLPAGARAGLKQSKTHPLGWPHCVRVPIASQAAWSQGMLCQGRRWTCWREEGSFACCRAASATC